MTDGTAPSMGKEAVAAMFAAMHEGAGPAEHVLLFERERKVAAQLVEPLRDYVRLEQATQLVFQAVLAAVNVQAPDQTSAFKVRTIQFHRFRSTLRSITMSAVAGYSLEALSLTASLLEFVFGASYIGIDIGEGDKWFAHERIEKSYPPIGWRELITLGASRMTFGGSTTDKATQDRIAKRSQDVYPRLCWAKHGNPMLSAAFSSRTNDGQELVVNMPHFSAATIAFSRFAILESVRLCLLGIDQYGDAFARQMNVAWMGETGRLVGEIERLEKKDLTEPAV